MTCSEKLAQSVMKELEKQVGGLNRQSIIKESLSDQCRLFVVESLDEAIKVANDIAPEHLELAVKEPQACAEQIRNAGAIFLGHYTPRGVGDYLAGPNHVLPTSGTARFSSPLGVYDFRKKNQYHVLFSWKLLKKQLHLIRILAEYGAPWTHMRMLWI